jgi:large subunit ribosomal protein L24
MHIRKDDIVEIITGDDKGKRGRVLSVDRKKGKLVVEGINRVYKHMRPSRQNAQGGRLSKEMAIDASNVLLIDPQDNRPTRVGVRYLPDGSKERYSRRTDASMGTVAPARKAHAEKG